MQGGLCYLQNKYSNPSTIFHVFSTCNFQGCSLIWKAARLRCPLLLKTQCYCEFAHFILKSKGWQAASAETQHLVFKWAVRGSDGGRMPAASPTSQTRLFPLCCWLVGAQCLQLPVQLVLLQGPDSLGWEAAADPEIPEQSSTLRSKGAFLWVAAAPTTWTNVLEKLNAITHMVISSLTDGRQI